MTKLSPFAAKKNKRDKNRVTIGKVGAPHGIHGEMRIIPLTDFVERFETMKEVMVGSEMLHIESCKYHKQYVLMKFQSGPEFPAELDRILGITDGILRRLITLRAE